ncbi:MAG: hypothetical protein MK085_13625, partial [Phycisphaerales bacterium]|nr:hypothetical protein [Phycisphaerales bacterium]
APPLIVALDEWDLPQWNKLLTGMIEHETPAVRLASIIALSNQPEADLTLALSRLKSLDERSTAVNEMINLDRLDPAQTREILESIEVDPSVKIMLIGLNRSDPAAEDLDSLRSFISAEDNPLLLEGMAASELAERGEETPLSAWLEKIRPMDESVRLRLISELSVISSKLESPVTTTALLAETTELPPDNLARGLCLAAALENIPDTGASVWQNELEDIDSMPLRGTLARMALDAEVPLDANMLNPLLDGPPLHIELAKLLTTSPENRILAAKNLVERGHQPTINWLVLSASERPDPMVDDALSHALKSMLDKPRGKSVNAVIRTTTVMARHDPEQLAAMLAEDNDPFLVELMLKAMAMANTAEASQAVAALPKKSWNRPMRSTALLTVARQGELDEQQLKTLGRIAAGGGRLPDSLRVQAAWIYLDRSNQLDGTITRLIAP